MQSLEERLTGEWFVDGRFTQADLTTGALLGYLNLRLSEVLAGSRFQRLKKLSAACEALPSFFAARPSPDEVMPS